MSLLTIAAVVVLVLAVVGNCYGVLMNSRTLLRPGLDFNMQIACAIAASIQLSLMGIALIVLSLVIGGAA